LGPPFPEQRLALREKKEKKTPDAIVWGEIVQAKTRPSKTDSYSLPEKTSLYFFRTFPRFQRVHQKCAGQLTVRAYAAWGRVPVGPTQVRESRKKRKKKTLFVTSIMVSTKNQHFGAGPVRFQFSADLNPQGRPSPFAGGKTKQKGPHVFQARWRTRELPARPRLFFRTRGGGRESGGGKRFSPRGRGPQKNRSRGRRGDPRGYPRGTKTFLFGRFDCWIPRRPANTRKGDAVRIWGPKRSRVPVSRRGAFWGPKNEGSGDQVGYPTVPIEPGGLAPKKKLSWQIRGQMSGDESRLPGVGHEIDILAGIFFPHRGRLEKGGEIVLLAGKILRKAPGTILFCRDGLCPTIGNAGTKETPPGRERAISWRGIGVGGRPHWCRPFWAHRADGW